MKKIIFATIIMIILSVPVLYSLDKKIVIVSDREMEGGYLAEITFEAFLRADYIPDFRFVPWARAIDLTIDGYYTMLMATFYSDDWTDSLAYSEPIGKTNIVLLKRKDLDLVFRSLRDLVPYRIGNIRGVKVNKDFDEAAKNYLHIEYVADAEQNIRKLLTGRIDLVVDEKERILELLKWEFRDKADKLEIVEPPLQTNYYYNCVSKKNPDYQQIIDDFNNGLKLLKEDGTLDWIYTKHGISPWQ